MHLVSSVIDGLSSATPEKETEATYCLMDTQVFLFTQAGYLTDGLTQEFSGGSYIFPDAQYFTISALFQGTKVSIFRQEEKK